MSRQGTMIMRVLGLLVLSAISVTAQATPQTSVFVTIHNCTANSLYPQITVSGNQYSVPNNVSPIAPGNVSTMQCPGMMVIDGARLSILAYNETAYDFSINGLNGSSLFFSQQNTSGFPFISWQQFPSISGATFAFHQAGATIVTPDTASTGIQGSCPSQTQQFGNLCVGTDGTTPLRI